MSAWARGGCCYGRKKRFIEVADEGRKGKEELTGICGAADFTLDFEMGGRDSFEEIVTCGAET